MMLLKRKTSVFVFVLLCYHGVSCKKSNVKRREKTPSQNEMAGINQQNLTVSIENLQDDTTHHTTTDHHTHKHKLEHKLENAPLPCMHEGPQPLKMEPRSAPMALESKYKDMPEQQEQRDQGNQPAFENSPNPQRPNASKLTANNNDTDVGDDGKPRHFNHPGHSQSSNNYPSEGYNYYGVQNSYGNKYPYNTQQPFTGYQQTSNIGVIPPRNQNARDYYNMVSGSLETPIVAKQGGLFSQLFGGNRNLDYSTIRYGMGGFSFGGNGYKNVLAGLFLWNLMNGYSTLRYDVYHFYNFPEWMIRDLSLSYESVIKCPGKATIICNNTQPLCTNENAIFCVTKDVVPCPNHENTCVETTLPFHETKAQLNDSLTMSLPCIANITLTGDDKPSHLELKSDMLDRPLCVTIVAVPQKPCNIKTQSGDETDCPMKPMATTTTTTSTN